MICRIEFDQREIKLFECSCMLLFYNIFYVKKREYINKFKNNTEIDYNYILQPSIISSQKNKKINIKIETSFKIAV